MVSGNGDLDITEVIDQIPVKITAVPDRRFRIKHHLVGKLRLLQPPFQPIKRIGHQLHKSLGIDRRNGIFVEIAFALNHGINKRFFKIIFFAIRFDKFGIFGRI